MSEQRTHIEDEELKKTLEELYRHYFRLARILANEVDQESAYCEAKAQGGVDAIGAIYGWLYGGKEFYDLWESEVNRHDETTGNRQTTEMA